MVCNFWLTAGAPAVLDTLESGGGGLVGSFHGHHVFHLHGEQYTPQGFALTTAEYAAQLPDFRRHVSQVAQHRHIVALGTLQGFLDSHFMAVWQDMQQLEQEDPDRSTWFHYILLRRPEVSRFQQEIIAQTPNPNQAALRLWIQQHIKIVVYGEDFEDLAPFVKHLGVAIYH